MSRLLPVLLRRGYASGRTPRGLPPFFADAKEGPLTRLLMWPKRIPKPDPKELRIVEIKAPQESSPDVVSDGTNGLSSTAAAKPGVDPNDGEYEYVAEEVDVVLDDARDAADAEHTDTDAGVIPVAERERLREARGPFTEYNWEREEPYPVPVPPELLSSDPDRPENHRGWLLPIGSDLTYDIGENYPRLKWVHWTQRDPYADWSDPVHRRNINDPIHHYDELMDAWSATPVKGGAAAVWGALARISAIVAVAFTAWYLDERDEHSEKNMLAGTEYNYPDTDETRELTLLLERYPDFQRGLKGPPVHFH